MTAPATLPDFSRGETLAAADLEAMVEAIRALRIGPGAGAGMGSVSTLRGMAVALTLLHRNVLLLARITRIYGVAVDGRGRPTQPWWPSEVTYRAEALWKTGVVVDQALPAYGRETHGDDAKVWASPVGSLCAVVRAPAGDGSFSADLWVWNETVYRRRCGGG